MGLALVCRGASFVATKRGKDFIRGDFKMNKWLTCFAVAFALSMVGCDDSDSNDTDTPQKQCTADKCKDSSVLLQCKDGQTTEVKCGVGESCADNACKSVDYNDK